jgi:MFS family permease
MTVARRENPRFFTDKRMTVWVSVITSFVSTFTASAVNLAIPAISQEFGSAATLTSWIISGYMLANTAFSLPMGRIADLRGRGFILKIGVLIFSVFSLACIFSTSMIVFILFRFLQGVGGALIFSTNMALLAASSEPNERGRALGYGVSAVYVGLSAGPVLGGLLNHYFQWRSIFIFTAVISFAVFVLAMTFLPKETGQGAGGSELKAMSGGRDADREARLSRQTEMPQGEPSGFDVLGSLLCVAMICAVMYGFSNFAESNAAKLLIPAGFALGAIFVLNELKTPNPLIDVRFFARDLSYSLSVCAALMNYAATFAISYLMSIYLQMVLGFDSQMAGIVLIVQPVMMALLAPLAGKLSDRVSPFKLASVGMAVCAVGLCSFAFLSFTHSLLHIIANLLVMGVGIGLFSTPNTAAVMSRADVKDLGVTTALLATSRSMGQTSGMAAITLIVSAYLGQATFAEATRWQLDSIEQAGFVLFTAVCVIGIFFSLRHREAVQNGKK